MINAELYRFQTGQWYLAQPKVLSFIVILLCMFLVYILTCFSLACAVGVVLYFIIFCKKVEVSLEIRENQHYFIQNEGPFRISYFYFGGFYVYLELISLESHKKRYFFIERWMLPHDSWRKLCLLSNASFNLMGSV